MSKKKYICHSGYVFSLDDDWHRISDHRLPELYRVDPAECIFIGDGIEARVKAREYNLEKYIHLYPLSDGNYEEYLDHLTMKENNRTW